MDNSEIDKMRAEMWALMEVGKLTASCPVPGSDEPWTEEEKAQLKAALADMFGWDK